MVPEGDALHGACTISQCVQESARHNADTTTPLLPEPGAGEPVIIRAEALQFSSWPMRRDTQRIIELRRVKVRRGDSADRGRIRASFKCVQLRPL